MSQHQTMWYGSEFASGQGKVLSRPRTPTGGVDRSAPSSTAPSQKPVFRNRGGPKNSEEAVFKIFNRVELQRMRGDLHGLRFGKNVSVARVKGYVRQVWAGLLEPVKTEFEGIRADYLVSYMRLPHGLQFPQTVAVATAAGALVH